MRIPNSLAAAILLTLSALAHPATPALTEDEAYQIGLDAYIYGFPVYEMYRTRQPNAVRGLNQINNRRALLGPEARNVVSPNNDTLYSSAWLDLGPSALLLEVPDTNDRYYCIQFMDIFTNNFAYIGRRTTGTKAGRFLIAGPQWHGTVPAGVKLIQSPTNTVWMLGRFLVKGPEDVPNVNALQDQLKLTPLTQAAANPLPAAPNLKDELDFFTVVNAALDQNPPPVSEAALMKRFALIGVGPDRSRASMRSPEVARGLSRAIVDGKARVVARIATQDAVVNGWNLWRSDRFGHWGDDYLLRAAVAYQGLAANDRQENSSSVARTDSEKRPLDGSKHYVLRFTKDNLPPVDAFWSLTMYGSDFFMVANPIHRYSIGDRTTGLKSSADGSFEIYVQHESPGPDKESNWLPSPEGGFYIALRCYQPRQPIVDGTYIPPAVKRID